MCGDLLDAVKLATEDVIAVSISKERLLKFNTTGATSSARNVQISFPATFRPNEMMKR